MLVEVHAADPLSMVGGGPAGAGAAGAGSAIAGAGIGPVDVELDPLSAMLLADSRATPLMVGWALAHKGGLSCPVMFYTCNRFCTV
jgi:hypothetical protein